MHNSIRNSKQRKKDVRMRTKNKIVAEISSFIETHNNKTIIDNGY